MLPSHWCDRNCRTIGFAVLFLVVSRFGTSPGLAADATPKQAPTITKGLVGVKLRERGAHLVEGFDTTEIDKNRWRLWVMDPDRTSLRVESGRFFVEGHGTLDHNGLWQLNPAKYKDVVLVARMDIRSQGQSPHECLLHLCGGDMPRSPDHWVEISMTDEGNSARFKVLAAVPEGVFHQGQQFVLLSRRGKDGFLAKLELDAGTNLCSASVWDGNEWREIIEPVELSLRTTHCELKIRRSKPPKGAETHSVAWFDDVRIYPRPKTHPVLFSLVRKDGSPPWRREDGRWPPTIQVTGQRERSIADLVVELRTADGKRLISRVQSKNLGYYMLSLKNAPWNVYPVAAKVRILLDGKVLGKEIEIPSQGLSGLYPDDVWDMIVE